MKGIVQPRVTPKTPRVGPRGVMTATRADLSPLLSALKLPEALRRSLYMSELFIRRDGLFLSGPFMGAPYAAMLLETLVAWGATEVVFLGWCGSISPGVQIGDILIPEMAWIDEGTSRGYHPAAPASHPSSHLSGRVRTAVEKAGLPFHEGAVWTTDAIFRETPGKVRRFHKKGALAVEMELSALFTVAADLNVAMAGILVVSDDLSGLTWVPGFQNTRFLDSRQRLLPVLADFCNQSYLNRCPDPASE